MLNTMIRSSAFSFTCQVRFSAGRYFRAYYYFSSGKQNYRLNGIKDC